MMKLSSKGILLVLIFTFPLFSPVKPNPSSVSSMKNVIHNRTGPTRFKGLASHFGVFWTDSTYSFSDGRYCLDFSQTKFLQRYPDPLIT